MTLASWHRALHKGHEQQRRAADKEFALRIAEGDAPAAADHAFIAASAWA
jgi:hypothetical protein